MPMSEQFEARLRRLLPVLIEAYGTPFHIYDESGIVQAQRTLQAAFSRERFRQHFAVKALPNPWVLGLLVREGSGLDCSSLTELALATRLGIGGDGVAFTSNNTSFDEYEAARELGALITFDDLRFFDRVVERDAVPAVVSFRVAPSALRDTSGFMGGTDSKFGVPAGQLEPAYRAALEAGCTRFGIHAMTYANELDVHRALSGVRELLECARSVGAFLGIDFEYVNIGGGLGIPYRPGEKPFALEEFARGVSVAIDDAFPARRPRLLMECGRYIMGPHGVLVTTVINLAEKTRHLIGVDASMSSLMRPGLYGAYHHISLPLTGASDELTFDVVGSLCENIDKFATERVLPVPRVGDPLLIHDTGAHGHSMGFNYNGRLRCAELLLRADGDVEEIRRAETVDDYLRTVPGVARSVLHRPVAAATGGADPRV